MTADITAMIAVVIEFDPPSLLLLLLAAKTPGTGVVRAAAIVGGRDSTSDTGAKMSARHVRWAPCRAKPLLFHGSD
jgi:hypothetical protein